MQSFLHHLNAADAPKEAATVAVVTAVDVTVEEVALLPTVVENLVETAPPVIVLETIKSLVTNLSVWADLVAEVLLKNLLKTPEKETTLLLKIIT
jgi:hypothetical protein